jgi:hypothetical protein
VLPVAERDWAAKGSWDWGLVLGINDHTQAPAHPAKQRRDHQNTRAGRT